MDKELLAARLRDAYHRGPVAPLRDGLDPTDAVGAYEIQAINVLHWVGQGRRRVGSKIGLTAVAVQRQLGVDRPDFGALFADMEVEDGGKLEAGLLQPKVEAEVALVLADDLDNRHATTRDVIAATAYVLPAIEIVDSRIKDWAITFADTVADNASSAAFVLGRDPKPLGEVDLRMCGMVLEVDGVVSSVGVGAACLGHPLSAAAWLARTLSELGSPLRARDVVLTGALGPMAPIKPGSSIRATICGLGSCGFRYG